MKKDAGNVLIIGIILIVLISVGVGYVVSRALNPAPTPKLSQQEEPQATQAETGTPLAASPTNPTYTDPNVKTFTSDDLGIRFSYLEKQQTPGTIGAKQVGNKVYVYDISHPPDQGQYVEVFTKATSDSLKEALTKQFLKGYPTADCFAEKINDPVAKQKNPASFIFAHITFPRSPNDGMEEISTKADKCPKSYTETNGIAYFLMDSKHPTQFVFFSIGQYAIDGPGNTTWQNTIQFLK